MTRRRRVDDDARVAILEQRVRQQRERVDLVNAGRRQRQQIARDRSIVRQVHATRDERIEQRVDAGLIFVAQPGKRRRRVHLSREKL